MSQSKTLGSLLEGLQSFQAVGGDFTADVLQAGVFRLCRLLGRQVLPLPLLLMPPRLPILLLLPLPFHLLLSLLRIRRVMFPFCSFRCCSCLLLLLPQLVVMRRQKEEKTMFMVTMVMVIVVRVMRMVMRMIMI